MPIGLPRPSLIGVSLLLCAAHLVPDGRIGGMNLLKAGFDFKKDALLTPKHAVILHAISLGKRATFHVRSLGCPPVCGYKM
jgi:hypothetical protein